MTTAVLPSLASPSDQRLGAIRSFYDATGELKPAAAAYRRALAHYYRLLIPEAASVLEIGCGGGELLSLLPNRDVAGIDISAVQIARARQRVPHGKFFVQAAEELAVGRTFDVVILSDTVNEAEDLQELFTRLHAMTHRGTRLILNFHNTLWRPLLTAAAALGLIKPRTAGNWLSVADIRNLLDLADWQVIRAQSRLLCPAEFGGFGRFVNRFVAPLLPALCMTVFCVARPRPQRLEKPASVSVVIPARNESGNIENAIRRLPPLGSSTEILFIEGNSNDDTWDEITRVQAAYPKLNIRALKQTGKGKGNAVREAFAVATGDILMILDADLTMPPEQLPKYYDALVSGRGEFANGVRLVYPMQDQAMRFCNMCANKFFGAAFSWLLGQPIKDTLCGTKALRRADYERIAANRAYFGEFDPFGDFDLIFGADKLQLKIVDVPIRYQNRTYGETNIQRWRHGAMLLGMLCVAAKKLKFV